MLKRLIDWLTAWISTFVFSDRVEEQSRQIAMLQDRNEMLEQERTRAWEMLRESLAGERIAYQSQINRDWQLKGHGIPYPEAPHVPPAAEPIEPDHQQYGRRLNLPSQIYARQARQTAEKIVEKALAGKLPQ
jgi:hypothetical protein